MGIFKYMFNKQKQHDDIWIDRERFLTDKEYQHSIIKERILIMIDQLIKLLNNFSWKSHRNKKESNIENSIEQLIDVFKFDIGLFSLLGYDENDFSKMFIEKSEVLEIRWEQEKNSFTEKDKVVVFDIDGVIADYDKGFIDFIKKKGHEFVQLKRTSYNYSDLFGLQKIVLENYSNEFINNDGFRNLPIFEDAIRLMLELKDQGYMIALITARPAWIHSKIILDTIYWLKTMSVPFDKIFFDKDKSDVIINKIYPGNVQFIVEDRDKHAVEMSHLGHKIFLKDYDYNSQFNESNYKNIIRVNNCLKIKEVING